MNPVANHAPETRRIAAPAGAAFTLIEVLLAVTISAIVLAAINVVFFGAIHLRERAAEVTEATQPLDQVVAVMKRDLRGIIYKTNGVLAGPMASDTTAIGMNQPVALEFFTTSGVLEEDTPFGDIQRIDYALQDATNKATASGRDLVRNVSRNLLAATPETPQAQRLIGDVQQLKFTYYDGTNWVESWSTNVYTTTPTAIRVHVAFSVPKSGKQMNPPLDFLVPVVMSGLTSTNTAD